MRHVTMPSVVSHKPQSKTPVALTEPQEMRRRFHVLNPSKFVTKNCLAGQLSLSRRIHISLTRQLRPHAASLKGLKGLTHPRSGLISRNVGRPLIHKHSKLIQTQLGNHYCTMTSRTQPPWTPPKPVEGFPKVKIYNSLTRRKDDFYPADEETGTVRFYSCGATVYDDCHLGHGLI